MSESPQADHAREESLAFSRAEAAEQQVKEDGACPDCGGIGSVVPSIKQFPGDRVACWCHASVSAAEADRDHAREERDTLQAIVADVFAVLGESDIEYKAPFLHRRMKAVIKKAEGR